MKYRNLFVKYIALIGMFFTGNATAQELLSLEDAVSIALENNYNIRISRNSSEINRNNVSLAAAGILPNVTGNFNNNGSLQNTRQTQADGSVREQDGARNWNSNYGVSLNWTIFDGFAMFAAYDQLKEFEKLGETNVRAAILTTVSDVINNYYNLVRLQQELAATDSVVAISRLRLTTAQNRYVIGKAAKLEVLTATVDLNTDTTSLLRQRELLRSGKIALNELLGRDVATNFTVSESIQVDRQLNYGELQQLSSSQNPAIQTAFINERIARLNLKQVKAYRYPVIGISSGYNFTKSHSELGFARDSRGRGLTYGISASVNIFNGFLQKRNERNAEIEIQSAQLEYERMKQNINAQLLSAYQTYQTNLELVKLEQSNLDVAKENMDITLAKFKLGSLTPVEFREAQRNYLQANIRFTDAQYQAKQAEVALKELAGNLAL